MVGDGFFTDLAIFRCVEGFVAQFGISNSSNMNSRWSQTIRDDYGSPGSSVINEFAKGTLSFAGNGPNSRSSQLFITLADQSDHLGTNPWETPVARLVDGEEVLDRLYTGYGEQPDQASIYERGNSYLKEEFPRLDYIKHCQFL